MPIAIVLVLIVHQYRKLLQQVEDAQRDAAATEREAARKIAAIQENAKNEIEAARKAALDEAQRLNRLIEQAQEDANAKRKAGLKLVATIEKEARKGVADARKQVIKEFAQRIEVDQTAKAQIQFLQEKLQAMKREADERVDAALKEVQPASNNRGMNSIASFGDSPQFVSQTEQLQRTQDTKDLDSPDRVTTRSFRRSNYCYNNREERAILIGCCTCAGEACVRQAEILRHDHRRSLIAKLDRYRELDAIPKTPVKELKNVFEVKHNSASSPFL